MRETCETHGYVPHDEGRCIECTKAEASTKRKKFLNDRKALPAEDRLAELEAELYDMRLKKLTSIVFG